MSQTHQTPLKRSHEQLQCSLETATSSQGVVDAATKKKRVAFSLPDSETSQNCNDDAQTCLTDWFMSHCRERVGPSSWTTSCTDAQGISMPPPPPKPGPSRRKPPPLVSRIKAKARRAKRKQQKAEYRRRLFLSHMVTAKRSAHDKTITTPALSMLPERLGTDLASFVDTVFDTDAQSSEITDPSDISDDDLAGATRTEIGNRKKLDGADIVVPAGVYRWMVAKDFAERWPEKVKGVRRNPWPGLENVWGLPSTVAPGGVQDKDEQRDEREPMRWQSGKRSRFIRRKEKPTAQQQAVQVEPGPTQSDPIQSAAAETPQAFSSRPAAGPSLGKNPMMLQAQAQALSASVTNPDESGGVAASPIVMWQWNSAACCWRPAAFSNVAHGVPILL